MSTLTAIPAAHAEATGPAAGLCVQLAVEHAQNRLLLTGILGDCGDFGVDAFSPDAVDLVVADARGLRRCMGKLARHRQRVHPQLLPCLLLQPARSPEPAAEIWELVDDVVRTPVRRRELEMRTAALARTRRLSLTLADRAAQVQSKYEQLGQLHAQLQAGHARLKEISAQKSQLLGTAAHDLRNPLSVIHQYARLMRDGDPALPEGERRRLLDVVGSTSGYLLELVDDLLDGARLEAGRPALDPRTHDLRALVEAALDLSRIVAGRREVTIEVDLPDAAAPVHVDAAKIRQVLDNLLGNAVEHSPPRTVIQVRLVPAAHGYDLSVRDQGPGIPVADLERLFEPFERGRGASGRGVGLGLAIVRRLVDAHGGRLAVTTQPGAGSTFTVWIPRASRSAGDKLPSPVPLDPVLVDADRERLAVWRRRDAQGCAEAVEGLREAIPRLLADVEDAAAGEDAKRLERAAYRAGWQVRHLSGVAYGAAVRLEAAARAGDGQTGQALQDCRAAMSHVLRELGVGAEAG